MNKKKPNAPKKNILIILISVFLLFSVNCSSAFECKEHVRFGMPNQPDQFLCREGYAVGYNYSKKGPEWVAYYLTKESVNKKFKRSNKFLEDKEVPERYRANLSDYKKSGYDRGHIAASATVDSSEKAMKESMVKEEILKIA